MADLQILADELTNDPLVRGYAGMTDADAAADLNLVNRDGPADLLLLLQYVTLERFRTGNIFGRIKLVAETRPVRAGNAWEIPPVPLGVGDADLTPTQDQIAAAAAFMRYLDVDTISTVTMLDSRIDSILTDLGPSGCEALGAGDKTAIQALSNNRQSRAQERGIGFVRPGDVAYVRAN